MHRICAEYNGAVRQRGEPIYPALDVKWWLVDQICRCHEHIPEVTTERRGRAEQHARHANLYMHLPSIPMSHSIVVHLLVVFVLSLLLLLLSGSILILHLVHWRNVSK